MRQWLVAQGYKGSTRGWGGECFIENLSSQSDVETTGMLLVNMGGRLQIKSTCRRFHNKKYVAIAKWLLERQNKHK